MDVLYNSNGLIMLTMSWFEVEKRFFCERKYHENYRLTTIRVSSHAHFWIATPTNSESLVN